MESSTSSFRIPDELRRRLELTALHMKKRKNWIITRAIEEYLEKTDPQAFAAEARRQSILASATPSKDDNFWASLSDDTGWR